MLDIQAMICLQNDQRTVYHQDHPDLSHPVTQIIAMTIQIDRKAPDDTGGMISVMKTEDLQATGQEAESVVRMGTAIIIALDNVVQAALETKTGIEATDTALLASVVAPPAVIESPRCVPTTTTDRETTEAAVRPQIEDLTDVVRAPEENNRLSASKAIVSEAVDIRFPLAIYSSKVPQLVPTTNRRSLPTPPNRVVRVSNQGLELGIVHK
jgi:hypothetical protein